MSLRLILLLLSGASSCGRPLTRDFLGYNLGAATLIHPAWGQPSFTGALGSLNPRMLRFPSGTYGNCWNWTAGATMPPCHATPPGGTTLADFKRALAVNNATAIMMLNMITSSLEEQVSMLRAAQAAGIFVDAPLVELGNEFYFGEWSTNFADGTAYGRECALWIDSISSAFPKATFAVVSTPSVPPGGARIAAWNAQLFAALAGRTFAVTMHEYHASGIDCGGCALTRQRAADMLAQVRR
jgi:hypothetical protein